VTIRRVAISALLAAAFLYAAVLGTLYIYQQRLIYPGWWRGTAAARPDLSGYRDIATTTSDGLRGRLLYHPPIPGKPVILFFHGNGDDVRGSATIIERLVASGYGAVLPEYRGYDGSPGIPTEQGLYRDARAARTWMTANGIGDNRVVVMGYSLGTGVAVQMATEMKPRALVLIAPYASIAHIVTARLPWIPGALVSERFDSASKIWRIDCPVLLLHGAADRTIPAENSALLKILKPNADRILFPGVGHEVAFSEPARSRIAAWLKEQGL
jgi:pimeloyl-ACP methyl ester carboxylesterase